MTKNEFVGRIKTKYEIKNIIDCFLKNDNKIIFITGEGGIGKTRLAEEIGNDLLKDGYYFCGSKCPIFETYPYYPYKSILRDILGIELGRKIDHKELKKNIKKIAPSALGLIPIIGPFLGLGFQVADISYSYKKEISIEQIFDSVTKILIEISDNYKGLVIFIDDVQYIDTGSISYTDYLFNLIKKNKLNIIFILIAKSEEIVDNDNLCKFLTDYKEKKLKEILIPPLSDQEIIQLTRKIIKNENSKIPLELIKKCEGNPLYLEQILNDLQESNLIIANDNQEIIFRENINKINLSSLYQTIQDRLNKINKNSGSNIRKILDCCSILGNEIPLNILRCMIESEDSELISDLSALQDRKILSIELMYDNTILNFSHDIIREVKYNSIPIEIKKDFHDLAGKCYENLEPSNILAFSYHYLISENNEKIIKYGTKSGKILFDNYTFKEARNIFEKVVDVANLESEKSSLSLSNYYLAEISYYEGKYKDALNKYEDVINEGVKNIHTNYILKALNRLGYIYYDRGNYSESQKLYGKSLSISRAEKDEDTEALSQILLGYIFYDFGEIEKAIKNYNTALSIVKKKGNHRIQARALNALAYIFFDQGDEQKALKYHNEALDISNEIKDLEIKSWTLASIGRYFNEIDRSNIGINYLMDSLEISMSFKYKRNIVRCYNFLTHAYINLKRINEAEEYIQRATDMAKELNYSRHLAKSYNLHGKIMMAKANLPEALKFLKKAYNESEKINFTRYMAENSLMLGQVYNNKKKFEEAEKHINDAIGYSQKIRYPKFEFLSFYEKGLFYLNKEQKSNAIECFDKCYKIAISLKKDKNNIRLINFYNEKILKYL